MPFYFQDSEWRLRSHERSWSLAEFAQGLTRPVYVYNLDDVRARARAFRNGAERVHYAMKANSHPRLLRLLQSEGLGVDVVSLGEMQLALNHGFSPSHIIFSGVGKDKEELTASLKQDIFQINVESFEELKALSQIARNHHRQAKVALRVNIHLAAPTHKHIQTATEESKFGLDIRLLPEVLMWLKDHTEIQLTGLAVHIGSQILDVGVFESMSRKMGEVYREIKEQGFPLTRLDLGGGLGLDYQNPGADDMDRLSAYLKAVKAHNCEAQTILEPGRFLVARSGVLLAKVVYVKRALTRQFAILNAGMNSLMRPALYQAYHRIEPLRLEKEGESEVYSVVGPICESTDTFAEDRTLPKLSAGQWVGIFDAGAYGAVMANTYNESALPAQWTVLDGVWEVK